MGDFTRTNVQILGAEESYGPHGVSGVHELLQMNPEVQYSIDSYSCRLYCSCLISRNAGKPSPGSPWNTPINKLWRYSLEKSPPLALEWVNPYTIWLPCSNFLSFFFQLLVSPRLSEADRKCKPISLCANLVLNALFLFSSPVLKHSSFLIPKDQLDVS